MHGILFKKLNILTFLFIHTLAAELSLDFLLFEVLFCKAKVPVLLIFAIKQN